MPSPFATLLHGHDTAECSYFLVARAARGIDFAALAVEKEWLRQTKARNPKALPRERDRPVRQGRRGVAGLRQDGRERR